MPLRTAAVLAGLIVLLAGARPAAPPPELLGLTLGMRDDEVRARLGRIGSLTELQPEGPGRKQIWRVRHGRYQSLNLRFDGGYRLQWCTAYARPRRVRYRDVGDTLLARRAGRFIWVWNVPAAGARPAYQVTARGTDPSFAASIALSPPLATPDEPTPPPPADSLR